LERRFITVLYGEEWQIPIFSEEEGKRRWGQIRELMEARDIECLVIAGHTGNYKGQFADIRYVSNYINWFDDEYCIFPLDAEPTLFVWMRQHEYWAEKVSWIPEIIASPPAYWGRMYVQDMVKKIKDLGLEKARLGIVTMRVMPASTYVGLEEQLPDAEFVEAGEILRACRTIKSDEELEFVRKAGEIADIGFEAMLKAAKPGVTGYELAAECEYAMIKAGAEVGSFTLFTTKQWPDGWGFTYGGNNRKFQKGDVILNEVTPCYGGYYVQLCRPISLGTPPDDFLEMLEIHKGMYEISRKECRPGNTIPQIDAKAVKWALSKREFSSAAATFQNTDSITLARRFRGELRPGMVYMIHPWTNPPEAELRAKKGHMGHLVGDTCIVTEGEAESVSRLPLELRVV